MPPAPRRSVSVPAVLLALFVGAAALVAGTGPARGQDAAVPARLNVLFLLADDLGYGDLGCFGHPAIRTPHLDALAKEGLRLTHCYSGSPVCSPSRAAFLTGRNPNRLGIRDWIPPNSGIHLKRDETTLATLLNRAGYQTGHWGKWHLNSRMDGSEPTPGDHGFKEWTATQNNAAPSHQDPVNFVKGGPDGKPQPVGPLKGNSSTLTADAAIDFLKRHKDGPFFAQVWFHAPHEPVAVPEEEARKYGEDAGPNKAQYYGSVSLLDREAGRIVKALDDLGLRENTLVFFTSDNGPETLLRYKAADRSYGSPGPLRGMKLHVTEAGYRVPGILRWPARTKLTAGSIVAEPVAAFDLLPTVCAAAGVALPADRALDGANFLSALNGAPVERKSPLYWQYDRAISRPWTLALRDGEWKLLSDAAMTRFELYRIGRDTGEEQNLALQHPEQVRRLTEKLRQIHREINPTASVP